jgi:hypothetical protein
MKDKFIELKGSESSGEFIINLNDIMGVYTYTYNFVGHYSVIVRGVRQWVSVDAETYFKVKNLLKGLLL